MNNKKVYLFEVIVDGFNLKALGKTKEEVKELCYRHFDFSHIDVKQLDSVSLGYEYQTAEFADSSFSSSSGWWDYTPFNGCAYA